MPMTIVVRANAAMSTAAGSFIRSIFATSYEGMVNYSKDQVNSYIW